MGNTQRKVNVLVEDNTNNGEERQQQEKKDKKKQKDEQFADKGNSKPLDVVLKLDLHCKGCASKDVKFIRGLEGVERVDRDLDANKLTVVGDVDPAKLREKVELKKNKKVELVSPVPKKENKENAEKNSDGKQGNEQKKEKEKKKKKKDGGDKKKDSGEDDKPSDEKEIPVTTAVMKVSCPCDGCFRDIKKIVAKTSGYENMKKIDGEEKLLTVEGAMDMKALADFLKKQLKKDVQIVPPKRESGGGGDNNGNGGGKKGKGGGDGNGGGKSDEGKEKSKEVVGYLSAPSKNACCNKDEHSFELESFSELFICDGCKQQGFGQRYRCLYCKLELHKECKSHEVTAFPDFFRDLEFRFFDKPQAQNGRCCAACGEGILGFNYQSIDGKLDLHPCCTKLLKKLPIEKTLFELRKEIRHRCIWCQEKKISGGSASGLGYASRCGDYHFHVHCLMEMLHTNASIMVRNWGLEQINLQHLAQKLRKKGKSEWRKFTKIVKMFLATVLSILLGDPTTLLITAPAAVLVNLLVEDKD